jgi:RNA polymerase sigma factor (TIGR02999 family)
MAFAFNIRRKAGWQPAKSDRIFFMAQQSDDITRLLRATGNGCGESEDGLLRAVYSELRDMAEVWMARTPPGQTLQPTALVHEAFLRMVGEDKEGWENRAHFFFAASRAMRNILVDRARAKGALKRGGDRRRIDLEKLAIATDAGDEDLLVLDDALRRFESLYPWEHRIVMLRFFAGLTNEQAALALRVPLRTLERDLRFARAWLRNTLSEDSNKTGG